MASFSLTEKLAVTGAFLAAVALVVGTEDDPGLVVTGQEAVKELRPVAPLPAPLTQAAPQADIPAEVEAPQPSPSKLTLPDTPPTAAREQLPDPEAGDRQFNTELGRVPLDFSKGPPPG